jgi:hypothetical protein
MSVDGVEVYISPTWLSGTPPASDLCLFRPAPRHGEIG